MKPFREEIDIETFVFYIPPRETKAQPILPNITFSPPLTFCFSRTPAMRYYPARIRE